MTPTIARTTISMQGRLSKMIEMYKYWRKNKRQIKMTITYLNSYHVKVLKRGGRLSEVSLDNIYSKLVLILWTSLAEVEFHILITENEYFTKPFVEHTDISTKSESEKWLALVDYFFRYNYLHRQDRELDVLSLGDTNFHRYETITRVIREDLGHFIKLRNRLAHGQWAVAFNDVGFEKNQELTTEIWTLSKKEIMLLKSFVTNLPHLIKPLIISRQTFERDYDKYMHRILKAKYDADLKYEWILRHRNESRNG